MKRGADDGRWREANACVPVQCWGWGELGVQREGDGGGWGCCGGVASLHLGSPRVSRGSEPACLNQNQDNLSHSACCYLSHKLQSIAPGWMYGMDVTLCGDILEAPPRSFVRQKRHFPRHKHASAYPTKKCHPTNKSSTWRYF